ncbi:nucleotidyltransferase domain-containing protein [Aeromicrobium sp. UC242_57]|uniref:nucleotidyltransferase domain-containing protein n=1 Tax=Aeromicrobium sp. UC242_57 TaxID=3374624 RepID=UPI0037B408FF
MISQELAQRRKDRALEADRLLRQLFAAATPHDSDDPREGSGLALVAVGGYGRSELSPFSDLDVVLLHDPSVEESVVREVAEAIWYPLWDRGVALDHSVRDTVQMRETARTDHRAAMGMLDARPVAGDAGQVMALRSQVLADWRRDARARVEEVRESRLARIERAGWIAHAAVPDLKESGGGLRDSVTLRALVATWLIDVPHHESEQLRGELLDVRDALHEVAGRRAERLDADVIPEVARLMDLGAEEARPAHPSARSSDRPPGLVGLAKDRRRRRTRPQADHHGDRSARPTARRGCGRAGRRGHLDQGRRPGRRSRARLACGRRGCSPGGADQPRHGCPAGPEHG